MSVAKKLEAYESDYWDFKDVKREGVHSIANYPASMVAPMQYEILNAILEENPNYNNLLDPFHGSGVTLVEADSLGLDVCGIDINPYAGIICNTKLSSYCPEIMESANCRLFKRIDKIKRYQQYDIYFFDKIDKWFREDIIRDLSIIRSAIVLEEDKEIRQYYWLCFGEIVKKHSNTRTSTFKLHVKEKIKIEQMENTVLKMFSEKVSQTYRIVGESERRKYKLYTGDSIQLMNEMNENSFDLICTSPPYGDNGTTVTYGQFSVLQLLWIDNQDFSYSQTAIDNFSKIDSLSLGGCLSNNLPYFLPERFNKYLKNITEHKRKKISRFFADYENSFRAMTRLLRENGTLVLTLGNRRVDDFEFPFVELNEDLARYYNLSYTYKISRNILNKRMPYSVSKLETGNAVKSMSKEIVLIFKKEKRK